MRTITQIAVGLRSPREAMLGLDALAHALVAALRAEGEMRSSSRWTWPSR
jgi:hypothetical protein